jgi:hypothetical protein
LSKSWKSHCCYQTANVMFIMLAGFECARQGKRRASQVSKSDCPGLPVTKPFILSGPVGLEGHLLTLFGSD